MLGQNSDSIWGLVTSGGFAMYPLLICSLLSWGVIFERLWNYRKLGHELKHFHFEAIQMLLRGGDIQALNNLCHRHPGLPTARVLQAGVERLLSTDKRMQAHWVEALERRRQLMNQDLRQNLWILGTIGAASPFIGLFGTVVGILTSFQSMARTGSGGFAVVASGISQSLVATAAGIVVAVIAVMAYNAFQTRCGRLVLQIRIQLEEFIEILQENHDVSKGA